MPTTFHRRAMVLGLIALGVGVAGGCLSLGARPIVDLDIYRAGAQQIVRGKDLYRDFPRPMPFSYPPFAALLFLPMTVLPLPVLAAVWNGLSTIALQWCGYAVARDRGLSRERALLIGGGTASLSILTTVVHNNFHIGQINAFLVALVLIGYLSPRARGGVGLGLAAAIKVLPAGFGLAWLLDRRWKAAAVSVLTALAATAVGFALWPQMSWYYFRHVVLDTGRPGGNDYVDNQSIRGMLIRFHVDGLPLTLAWLTLSLAMLALAVFIVPRITDRTLQILAVADVMLLASPISWTFHWLWVTPLLVWLVIDVLDVHRPGGRWRVLVVFLVMMGPLYHFVRNISPLKGQPWAWWEHLIGNQVVWCGMAALCYGAWLVARRPAELRSA